MTRQGLIGRFGKSADKDANKAADKVVEKSADPRKTTGTAHASEAPSGSVVIRDVSFAYRHGVAKSLEAVSLAMQPGEVVLVTGASGSGKTTITRLINGLAPHFYEDCELSGDVCVAGMAPADVELCDLTPVVGSVFQSPKTQFFCLNTTEELAFSCENLGMSVEETASRIERTAADFGLNDLLGRNPFDLSGGEAQRVACGSASMLGPSIMVLDEPSSNLDARSIWRLREIIARWRASGRTVIVSEHRLHYLAGLVDRVLFMQDGRVKRAFGGEEFYALSLEELHDMGLRAAQWSQVAHASWLGEGRSLGTVHISDLRFTYRRGGQGIRVGSLRLERGCITALVGANGSGKSTLARCLCGLLRPSSGTIDTGHGPQRLGKKSRDGFLVMQNVAHQLFRESVLDEVVEAQPQPDEATALKILETLDLAAYADAHPLALSGGQQQRVAIATALASGRSLLVLDEPTSGLDLLHMRQVADAVRCAAAERRAVFVITHDFEFIQACCTHFVRMRDGEVTQTGVLDDSGRAQVLDFFDEMRR